MDLNRFLEINQVIHGPKAYAVQTDWYNKFQHYLECQFDNVNITIPSLTNYSLCIVFEDIVEGIYTQCIREKLKQQLQLTPELVTVGSKEQLLKKDKRHNIDYIVVNPDLWNFMKDFFSGGPPVPLYSIPTNSLSNLQMCQLVTASDQDNISRDVVFYTDNEFVSIVVQRDTTSFTFGHYVVPLYYTFDQTLLNILKTPDLAIYDPARQIWVDPQAQIQQAKNREFWALRRNQFAHQLASSTLLPNHDEVDEQQISQDFQQLRQDSKTRSTEPTTESIIETSETQVGNGDFDPPFPNGPELTWPDLEEFRGEIELRMQGPKQPLHLLQKNEIQENLDQLIQALEYDLSACMKMEQKEEKTNDDLQEQDI